MSTYTITVSKKGLTEKAVDILCSGFTSAGMDVIVRKQDKLPASRPERFSAAISEIENGKSEIECLRDELQEWHDNLPENLQSSPKADELDEAVQTLEDIVSNLDETIGNAVNFPGMY